MFAPHEAQELIEATDFSNPTNPTFFIDVRAKELTRQCAQDTCCLSLSEKVFVPKVYRNNLNESKNRFVASGSRPFFLPFTDN